VDSIPGVELVSPRTNCLKNTIAFVVENADSITLLAGLDLEGICASSGSACSAGSLTPSHVVSALGLEPALANSLVRFSLGRESSLAEVELVAEALPTVVHRAQVPQQPPKEPVNDLCRL
jgi:cysteine desulfurase